MTDENLTEAEVLEKYRPFIVSTAKRFLGWGLSLDDLVQEAQVATIRSWRQWRPGAGACLLTWIRQPVRNALGLAVRKARNHGLRPIPRTAMREDMAGRVPYASMDAPIPHCSAPDGLPLTLHDVLGTFDEPPDYFARERLIGAVSSLPTREREVIRWRFVEGLTLKQIGGRLGLTRERVRQIESIALAKLRQRLESRISDVH